MDCFEKKALSNLSMISASLAFSLCMALTLPVEVEAVDVSEGQGRDQGSSSLLKFRPMVGNEVVRMSQEGTPVTYLQDLSIRLGKEMAREIEADEAARRARGEKVPERIKRDVWAEREKEIAERRAKHGPETTKKFTIPGTTPEISGRIFGPGGRVYQDEDGNTVYETKEETVTQYADGTVRILPRETVNIVLTGDEAESRPQENTPATAEADPHHGSLDGVEKGFDARDIRDAAAILIREGKGIRVEGWFGDTEGSNEKSSECGSCKANGSSNAGASVPVSAADHGRARRLHAFVPPLFGVEAARAETKAERNDAEAVEAIVRQGRALMEKAEASGRDHQDWARSRSEEWAQAEAMELVRDLARAGRLDPKIESVETFGSMTEEELRRVAQAEAANPSSKDTYIFISYSLGDDALMNILEAASGKDNVELVMRGIPEESNLVDGLVRIRDLAAKFDPVPNIIIDPMLFRAYGVKTVPTVVRVSEKRMARPKTRLIDAVRDRAGMSEVDRQANDDQSVVRTSEVPADYRGRTVPMMLAKVSGLNNARWLNEKIALGRTGDFGNRGYVYPIDEPDFIEVMQQRALGIDWEKSKQRAVDNFWIEQARRFQYLPTAGRSLSRVMDPTFMVSRDILDIKGRLLHKQGDLVNPLALRPFNDAVVVFNPRRSDEVEAAKRLKARFAKDKTIGRVVWIATEFDAVRGWDNYAEITEALDAPVYLLMPEIVDRWAITATPSVITADNETKKFIVEEIAPGAADPK